MSDCSCGGVSISCPGGCGCVCISESTGDCVRWCEPADPIFKAEDAGEVSRGALVRMITQPDGSQRMTIGVQVVEAAVDAPSYDATTALEGCLRGATRESLALVLNVLFSGAVRAPDDEAGEPIDESVSGTIGELAERYGLIVE